MEMMANKISKNNKIQRRHLYGLIGCFLLVVISLRAQDGESLFKANCSACHNIEGTPLMGPNLKNITKTRQKSWLKQFILNSKQMYDKGDPEAKEIIDKYNKMLMPSFSFSDQQLESIIGYLEVQSSPTTEAKEVDTAVSEKKDSTRITLKDERANVQKGFDLFTGKIPLVNRGSACISCHNVTFEGFNQGGTLARDLTHVFSRMNKNEAALRNVVSAMPFPAMAEAYKQHSLTHEEIEYLVLFLKHADNSPIQSHVNYKMLSAGVVTLGLFILLLSILYKRGKVRSVNFHIYKRQQRKNE